MALRFSMSHSTVLLIIAFPFDLECSILASSPHSVKTRREIPYTVLDSSRIDGILLFPIRFLALRTRQSSMSHDRVRKSTSAPLAHSPT
ncbi:uncharacterized protein F5Z01DRAFT_433862 [Emericellopsis atlantica]|uniref:Secreted protein n=1 Tax=Emericellopsis atlantica TaxID=2614577 RepID=A0A9P7ZDW1_9HYPO|nr:uncharacterized protein F5Z01DRAFT_433862 [Emericellopsis atlantica]KAG9249982.1 hypothetical protein F5Z01DRAFT_433862 [Emericellopsis atlantica]